MSYGHLALGRLLKLDLVVVIRDEQPVLRGHRAEPVQLVRLELPVVRGLPPRSRPHTTDFTPSACE